MKLDKIIAVRTGKTVYKDGDRVIKVFENGYSKADILNEALNQARIEETGLNIPKILGVSTENGKWAIISEYIKGKTLAQLMTENPDKFDEYLVQVEHDFEGLRREAKTVVSSNFLRLENGGAFHHGELVVDELMHLVRNKS